MNFLDPTNGGGIGDLMNRICGTTAEVYKNSDKIVDINEAITHYFAIGNYKFEDNNQTTAPIETINLVSGTSRYALSDLTSELLNFLRVEITSEDDADLIIWPRMLTETWDAYDEYYKDNGTPYEYFKIGKYIDIKPAPNYNKTAGLKIYFDRPASQYSFTAATVTIASPSVFTSTAHGMADGDQVILQTNGTLPTGFTADSTIYYVVNKAPDTFQLALTSGGTAINGSDSQTGTHTYLKVNAGPGIPSIHHKYLAHKASLEYLANKKLAQYNSMVRQVALDEVEIRKFFARRDKARKTGMSMIRNLHR
jgi:hypothetical protein